MAPPEPWPLAPSRGAAMRLATYGEAMIRYMPPGPRETWRGQPSGLAQVARSVGGDELNVAIALAKIGWKDAVWASVLPSGPLGDIVRETARAAGVCLSHCEAAEGEIGTYTVLPEEGKVHFQRGHSCFALQREGLVDWPALLGPRGAPAWLHLSGISPQVCAAAARCWAQGIEAASGLGLPVTLDLNHRPQLGTLEQLWAVVAPRTCHVHLLILSAASVRGLAGLLGVGGEGAAAKRPRLADGEGAEGALRPLLAALHAALRGPAVACCFKERDAHGVQRRWSVVVDSGGVHSTEGTPVLHSPKDECGGGSAWAAGLIDGLAERLQGAAFARASSGEVTLPGAAGELLRRADLLAAMCQESVGDHSTVTRPQLLLAERRWSGAAADLSAAAAEPEAGAADARVREALARMERAKVVAILRAKNEARAVERAKELVDLGFRAVEVTCDSVGFEEGRLLPALTLAVGDRCLVGVGTVTTVAQLQKAADGGARFALSPVRPTCGGFGEGQGFVRECHRRGVLAVPAAFSPQEIYQCVEGEGAHAVKIFPAQLWSPSQLRDLRRIGDFGKYRLCPSGGIDGSNVEAWLAAGAVGCGMGSCLAGKDIAVDPSDTAALEAAERDWAERGRPAAAALAARLFAS